MPRKERRQGSQLLPTSRQCALVSIEYGKPLIVERASVSVCPVCLSVCLPTYKTGIDGGLGIGRVLVGYFHTWFYPNPAMFETKYRFN